MGTSTPAVGSVGIPRTRPSGNWISNTLRSDWCRAFECTNQSGVFEIQPGRAASCVRGRRMNGPESEKNWTSAPQMYTNRWYFGDKLEQMASPIFDEGPDRVSMFVVQIWGDFLPSKEQRSFWSVLPSLFLYTDWTTTGRFEHKYRLERPQIHTEDTENNTK